MMKHESIYLSVPKGGLLDDQVANIEDASIKEKTKC